MSSMKRLRNAVMVPFRKGAVDTSLSRWISRVRDQSFPGGTNTWGTTNARALEHTARLSGAAGFSSTGNWSVIENRKSQIANRSVLPAGFFEDDGFGMWGGGDPAVGVGGAGREHRAGRQEGTGGGGAGASQEAGRDLRRYPDQPLSQ